MFLFYNLAIFFSECTFTSFENFDSVFLFAMKNQALVFSKNNFKEISASLIIFYSIIYFSYLRYDVFDYNNNKIHKI